MEPNRKKVAIVIEHKRSMRNFIASGSLEAISQKYDVRIWKTENAQVSHSTSLETFMLPNLSSRYLKINNFYHHCLLWRNRDRNMLMKTRAMNQFASKKSRSRWKSVLNYEIANWGEARRFLIRNSSRKIPLTFISVLRKILMLFEVRKQKVLERMFHDLDLILLPYGGQLSENFDFLVFYASRKGIISFALQENWDNLCSKSFLVETPNAFATWGGQSTSHLRMFHDVHVPKIFELGSPRFDAYLRKEKLRPFDLDGAPDLVVTPELRSVKKFKYILVGGTGDGIDDHLVLKSTLDALSELTINTNILIVFRPHPLTRTKTGISDVWQISKRIVINVPEENENPTRVAQLVMGAELVVNNCSTLTLEALLAGKRTIIPLFNGIPDARYRYDRVFTEAPHLIGMQIIRGLNAPRNQDEFIYLLRQAMKGERQGPLEELSDLKWFCHQGSYSDGLASAIEELFSDNLTSVSI